MYVVPAKVPVQAKKLIENYEKGKTFVEDDPGNEKPKQALYREMSTEELAKPGTAKKLLLEFETMKQSQAVHKSIPVKATLVGKLKQESEIKRNVECENNLTEISEIKMGDQNTAEINIYETSLNEKGASDEVIAALEKVLQSRAATMSDLDVKENYESKKVLIVSTGNSDVPLDKDIMEKTIAELKIGHHEVNHSCLSSCVLDDKTVHDEKQKLSSADLVIFYYKPILNTIPAKLKEWFEKILCHSFDRENGKIFENGFLKGKKCVLLVNMNLDKSAFIQNGQLGDVLFYLWPIQNGILRFVGFDVLAPEILYKAESTNPTNNPIESWIPRLLNMWQEKSFDCCSCIPTS